MWGSGLPTHERLKSPWGTLPERPCSDRAVVDCGRWTASTTLLHRARPGKGEKDAGSNACEPECAATSYDPRVDRDRLNTCVDLQEYEWSKQDRGWDDTQGERICLDCVVDPQLRANLVADAADTGEACAGCDRFGWTVAGDKVLSEMLEAVHLIYSDALGFMPVDGAHFVFDTTDGQDVMDYEFSDDLAEGAYLAIRPYVRADVSLAKDVDASEALEMWWERLRDALAASKTPTGLDAHFLKSFENLITRTRRLLRTVPQGTSYWRVRQLATGTTLADYASAKHMGSPPPSYASDNRFSRRGQSAFYGAEAEATAAAEVFQSTVGTAVGARFTTAREFVVLDLVDLPVAPSIYDKARRDLYVTIKFLRLFATDVSQPIAKSTGGEYRLTQLITDVVRDFASPAIGGIRYTSSQDGKPSIIVFAEPTECADPGEGGPATILIFDPDSLYSAPVH